MVGSKTDLEMSVNREPFEKWLLEEQGLDALWDEHRNCYEEFPAHLAWKAWQAASARPEEAGALALLKKIDDSGVLYAHNMDLDAEVANFLAACVPQQRSETK